MVKAIESGNVSAVLSRLRKPDARAKASVTKGMKAAARYVFNISQQLVPYDTGKLHASGRITETDIGIIGSTIEVSYGSPEVSYAIDVHEIPPGMPGGTHGKEYNIKYAAEILSGRRKPREPQEQFHYLSDAIYNINAVRAVFRKEII